MRTRQVLVPAAWLLTVALAFLAGWFAQGAYRFCTMLGKPHVRSEASIRRPIRVTVPQSARRLYYATEGFVDTNEFTAMTIDPGDFDGWRRACFGGDLVDTGSSTIPHGSSSRGPTPGPRSSRTRTGTCPRCSKVAVYAKGEWIDVLWCQEQGRVFICDWGH